MKKLLILLFFSSICGIITASAGPISQDPVNTGSDQTRDQVADLVAFVQQAADYAKEHGKEAACCEFSNKNGSFFRDSLYIYAYDFDGITLAHPLQTELIGVNRSMWTDAEGNNVFHNLSSTARNGSGFWLFSYSNPEHNNASEKKLGYVEKIDDTWWIGSGIYGEKLTLPTE